MDIQIDPFFENLFPPLSADALAHLHKSLSVEGQRETIKVWEETGIVLDGHNRLAWCDDAGVEPKIEYLSFPDRDSALDWVLDLAIGRRNLTPLGEAYCLGLRYGRERKEHGGDRKSSGQNVHLIKASEAIAKNAGVNEKTVRRNAEFATGLDKIAEKVGPEYKHAILTRDIKVNKGDVPLLSTATKGQLLAAFGSGADGLKNLIGKLQIKRAEMEPPKEEKPKRTRAAKAEDEEDDVDSIFVEDDGSEPVELPQQRIPSRRPDLGDWDAEAAMTQATIAIRAAFRGWPPGSGGYIVRTIEDMLKMDPYSWVGPAERYI